MLAGTHLERQALCEPPGRPDMAGSRPRLLAANLCVAAGCAPHLTGSGGGSDRFADLGGTLALEQAEPQRRRSCGVRDVASVDSGWSL